MKQLSLLALLLCFVVAGAKAVTVSGMVTNSVTGKPQAGMSVMITDSLSSPLYFDAMMTDASGAYSFTLPTSVSTGDRLTVAMTDSCLNYLYTTYTYAGVNIVKNFSGCPKPSGFYSIQCRFFLPGAASNTVRHFTGYLISKKYDPALMDTTLTVVDSFPTISANRYFTKLYTTLPAGQLLLKVALNPLDSEYVNYLPTYYDSVVQWSSARPLTTFNFTHPNYTDIIMKRATNPGGPGFIGGSVLLGANKSTAVGDPLSKRILILVNAATNKPVAYTHSDAAGKFNFPKLAYGTYKVFGDAPGKTNPVLTLTLSAAKPGYSNILFEENDKTFKGSIGTLSIGNGKALAGVSVYPNPVADHVRFSGLNTIGGEKSVVLTDVTGAVISCQRFAQGAAVEIPTANLPAGVYMLQLATEAGSASFRIVK